MMMQPAAHPGWPKNGLPDPESPLSCLRLRTVAAHAVRCQEERNGSRMATCRQTTEEPVLSLFRQEISQPQCTQELPENFAAAFLEPFVASSEAICQVAFMTRAVELNSVAGEGAFAEGEYCIYRCKDGRYWSEAVSSLRQCPENKPRREAETFELVPADSPLGQAFDQARSQ